MEAICIRFLRNSHHLLFAKVRSNIATTTTCHNNRVLSKFHGSFANAIRTFVTARPLSDRRSKAIDGKNYVEHVEEDFFGFNEGTYGVIAVERPKDGEEVDPLIKYGKDMTNVGRSEAKAEQEESVYFMSYGTVRFDGDNVPTVFEETVDANLPKKSQPAAAVVEADAVEDLNYVDRQYFVDPDERVGSSRRRNSSYEFRENDETRSDDEFASGFGDRLYSDRPSNNKDNAEVPADHSRSNNQVHSSNRPSCEPQVDQLQLGLSQTEDENLIEEQYFGSGNNTAAIGNPFLPFSDISGRQEQKNFEEAVIANSNYELITSRREPIDVGKFENAEEADRRSRPNADEKIKKPTKHDKRIKPDMQNPKTAYDYVMKLKAAKATSSTEDVAKSAQFANESGGTPDVKYKVDSKGFRIYKDQTRDLEKEPEMFVLQILKNSILYNDHDIVAISKPYGLQCHHGKGRHHRLTKFLPDLAKYVFRDTKTGSDSSPPELYTVHRLDVDTTGVLLLAKTLEMAKKLHDLFVEGKILKTYWALTKGVPSPAEGIVDIPIAEGTVDGRARMVLRPDNTEEARSIIPKYTGKTQRAVTAYKVFATHGNAALVELKPTTGVKHQLRVHLAFALGCPIIGDHKYSHLSKLAPQKLPSDVLQRLHLRQSKARYLPMHLHARGVIVPGVVEGRDLHIGANLPPHFKENMNKLHIHFKK